MEYSNSELYLDEKRTRKTIFDPCSQVVQVEIDLFLKKGGTITMLKSDQRESRTVYVPQIPLVN